MEINLNICRVCLKSEKGQLLIGDPKLEKKFEYTTQLKLKAVNNMPKGICSTCIVRLNLAFQFIRLARCSDNSLRIFLEKFNTDFHVMTTGSLLTLPEGEAIDETEQDLGDSSDALIHAYINSENKELTGEEQASPDDVERNTTPTKCSEESQNSTIDNTMVSITGNSTDLTDHDITIVGSEQQQTQDDQSDIVVYGYDDMDVDDENLILQLKGDTIQAIVHADSFKDDEAAKTIEIIAEQNTSANLNSKVIVENRNMIETENDASPRLSYGGEEEEEEEESSIKTIEDPSCNPTDENVTEEYDEEIQFKMQEPELMDCIIQNDFSVENGDSVLPTNDSEDLSNGETKQKSPTILPKIIRLKKPREEKKPIQANRLVKIRKVRPSYSNDDRLYCQQCNRDFSTRANLNRHMHTHNGSKPYPCEICGKGFTQSGSLKQHMYTHTGEKPYKCQICDRGFTQCKSLVFHMRRHTGVKPFQCDQCDSHFRQKDALKMHIIKLHTVAAPHGNNLALSCTTCKKLLPTTDLLQAHMKQHLNAAHTIVKNFTSTSTTPDDDIIEISSNNELTLQLIDNELLVGKDFLVCDDNELNTVESGSDDNDAAAVLDVASSSTDDPGRAKKFQCRKCFKCFALKKSLLRHLSIHDTDRSEMFRCKLCNMSFDTQYALKVHCTLQHKDNDTSLNECEECQLEFPTAVELTKHMQTHHIYKIDQATEAEETEGVFACSLCKNMTFTSEKLFTGHMLAHELQDDDDGDVIIENAD